MSRKSQRNRTTSPQRSPHAPKAGSVAVGQVGDNVVETVEHAEAVITHESVIESVAIRAEGPVETEELGTAEKSGNIEEASAADLKESSSVNDRLVEAVVGNSSLLLQLLADVDELRQSVQREPDPVASSEPIASPVSADDLLELESLRDQVFELTAANQRMQEDYDELEQQNAHLAAKVASQGVKKSLETTSSDSNESLSWEERKQLILRQMEEDSFDADDFISNTIEQHLKDDAAAENTIDDPVAYVNDLNEELSRRTRELERREDEITELNHLLENRPDSSQSGIAVGAAAIAGMIDGDELVREERERLQQLQVEWEEKFRQSEIELSLERAKLSRERQELSKQAAGLEEQLEHLRHESRQNEQADGHSRKWLAKLGLAGNDS
ncbi:hypothetical protein [Planctomycetes bacterium CA13]